jgi:adenine-specific DNA-methyltransferase
MAKATSQGKGKRVTRYTHEEVKEPRTPETGHAGMLPDEETLVSIPMDNGWAEALEVGHLGADAATRLVVDMDPAVDPVLFWAGKRTRRDVPVLPLQRNEIVSDSRIAQIIARARRTAEAAKPQQASLFADLERELREAERGKRVEFYTHEEAWKNKLICGDSLPVMESLIRYEGLSGQVQTVYIDPPYGIKYNANFQQRIDTTINQDADRADDVLTIKAFRDTWVLGMHSYLSYLAERLYLCRDLLTESGSVFVQINDTNVHVVRNVMDEVFGARNFCSMISFTTVTSQSSALIPSVSDYLLWYAKSRPSVKFRRLYRDRDPEEEMQGEFRQYELPDGSVHPVTREHAGHRGGLPDGARLFRTNSAVSGDYSPKLTVELDFDGIRKHPGANRHWKTAPEGMYNLYQMGRLMLDQGPTRMFKQYLDDSRLVELVDKWDDVRNEQNRLYVTQTPERVVNRCVVMTTDPGDIVFDPTCGSGSTAVAAERWGRRWITCDTSRVAINVARQRLLSSVFEHYKTRDGAPASGFTYETASRTTLGSLAGDQEPEVVELVDQPAVDRDALRVSGPFEVMSLGRYSIEDWKGWIGANGDGDPAKLQNYIEVICRLYRPHSAPQGAGGLVHAVAESESEKLAISVGPLTGRVTAQQVHEAVTDALSLGVLEVHLLGWAFEANVGEVKSKLESHGKVKVQLIMIRPDSLAEGLKVTNPDQLFSPLTLPEVKVEKKSGKVTITLKGVGVFDRRRRTTDYHSADDGYIVAWYLDEDYDGDCFVDCQSFFDFKKVPNLTLAAGGDIDAAEFAMQLTSHAFQVRDYKRAAVKVVDIFGNESTFVTSLT